MFKLLFSALTVTATLATSTTVAADPTPASNTGAPIQTVVETAHIDRPMAANAGKDRQTKTALPAGGAGAKGG
jgi:hypothetical protein